MDLAFLVPAGGRGQLLNQLSFRAMKSSHGQLRMLEHHLIEDLMVDLEKMQEAKHFFSNRRHRLCFWPPLAGEKKTYLGCSVPWEMGFKEGSVAGTKCAL